MPSFTSRHYTPERFRSFSKDEDDIMENITQTTTALKLSPTSPGSLAMSPSEGCLLGHSDLPSPPRNNAPDRPADAMGCDSSLNNLSVSSTSPGQLGRRHSSSSTPGSSPPRSSPLRWPTAFQRINRLPVRPRSRSASTSPSPSTSSSSSSPAARPATSHLQEDAGTSDAAPTRPGGPFAPPPVVRTARRTPYYPPNASRSVDRTRVYMHRGPHFVPNWTPLASLPRHVQLQIEERWTRFAAA
ncbi:hypothetical protein VTH06DRAFT_5282 [Thermothelomyces fergusii]